MASATEIKQFQLPNDTTKYDLIAKNGIFYIEGTGTTAGTWLGSHADITAYYEGLTVAYKVPVKGASTTKLNINSLGAVTVVKQVTTAVSTSYDVNAVVLLVYTLDGTTAYWKVADYSTSGDITAVTTAESSGLTGGKSSGSVALAVKDGAGIIVNSDGVNVGQGSGIIVEADAVSVNTNYTTSGKNYKVDVDSTTGGLYVSVPWTDTDTKYTLPTAGSTLGGVKTTSTVTSTSGLTACPIISGVPYYKDTNTQAVSSVNGKTGDVSLTYSDVSAAAATHNHAASEITSGTLAAARLPAATSNALGAVKIASNGNITNNSGTISVPDADGSTKGVTIVYPAASCTTFSSDSGTVTPLAVQKGAKLFAITRPPKDNPSRTVTPKAIARWLDTDGGLDNSIIAIEDVTNSKDSSKKAQVITIPAEGGKKMVYGYCTDQVDGTSFIGGVFDQSATSYPYNAGLAIGGTSGNLLWKGSKVISASDLATDSAAGIVKVGSNISVSSGTISLTKTNITNALGYTPPTIDTTYSNATTTAAGLMSAADKVKLDGITAGATANTGDITEVKAGNGLTDGGTSGSVTLNVGAGVGIAVAADAVKAKLRSETALTVDSAAATTTSGRVYPVAVDKTGYLAVNVPWTDTNTHAVSSVNGKTGAVSLTYSDVSAAAESHNHAASEITSGTLAAARLPAATTSALGAVKIGSNISVSSGTISVAAITNAEIDAICV